MRKFSLVILIFLLALLSSPLFAIGFGYSVLEIRTEPDFAKGIFPSSLMYQFNFPVPDFIGGNKTILTFRLDNGLVYRTLIQDPDTGKLYISNPDLLSSAGFTSDKERDYSVHFDEFNLLFSQGFLKSGLSDEDMITASVSFGGRFEMAFERLFFMYDKDNTTGAFQSSYGVERFPESSWNAYPELYGDRKLGHTFLNFGLTLNFMRDQVTRKDGVKLSSEFRYSPSWMPSFVDNKVEFMKSSTTLEFAKTLFSVNGNNGLSWVSAVFGGDVTYRYLTGSKIPYYTFPSDEVFGVTTLPSEHLLYSRIYMNIYGPQIYFKDLYPVVSFFHDIAYSFGKVINNTVGDSVNEWVASFGVKAQLIIFNYCNAFFEVGYVYKNPFTDAENSIGAKFGFSVGV